MDRATLRQWHIWLGWLVGLPFLFWTVSGLVMVVKPIEEVRGNDLIRPPAAMSLPAGAVVAPDLGGLSVKSLALEPRVAGPRWIIETADGTRRLADPATGRLVAPLSAAEAAAEIRAVYRGTARIAAVARTDRSAPPLDLRRPLDTWQVTMSDGTRFYVEAATGAVVAKRTRFWRIYDFFWGLHIMDLQGREDTHNPWIVGFAMISLLSVLMALVLLPMTIRRRRARR